MWISSERQAGNFLENAKQDYRRVPLEKVHLFIKSYSQFMEDVRQYMVL